jgi:hypothetical protein
MKLYQFFLIPAIAMSAASSVIVIKKYTQTNNFLWILACLILSMMTMYCYTCILKYEKLCYIYPSVKILSIILVTTSSIILFNEKINTRYIIGLLLGILSICILSTSSHSHK